MPQRRIHFPCHQVGFATDGSNTYIEAHGVQSVGVNTSFNLEQVFELGQIQIYENIENTPNVEMTMEKVLDGYPPLYLLATKGSATATLAGRSNVKCAVALSIFSDLQDSSSGTPLSQVVCSGMVVSQFSYKFPVEGNFSESLTLVGNNKVWYVNTPFTFSGMFNTNADEPVSIAGSGGVNRRENLLIYPTVSNIPTNLDANSQLIDPNCTILPGGAAGIPGITTSGTIPFNSDGTLAVSIQNISVSTNLNRNEIFQLGRKIPFFRFVNFPVEVTTEIEIISTSGDMIGGTEAGVISAGSNLANKTIRIATKEGLRLNMGTKNKIASVTYNGGDSTGGNVSNTFTFTTFNDLTVTHWADPTSSLSVAQGGTGQS